MSNTIERLNSLSKINQTKSYLEIGVHRGHTFHQCQFPYKVAVDPKFDFNTSNLNTPQSLYFEITSDKFWAEEQQGVKFDLIYLDGLHTFDQTMRDFCSSLAFSHEKTIWLIDDVLPDSFLASLADYKITYIARLLLPFSGTHWMGDCYKVICAIADFFPQYSYATFKGHGQTVVWKKTRKKFRPMWNSLKMISSFGYFKFIKNYKSILNLQTDADIYTIIKNDLYS